MKETRQYWTEAFQDYLRHEAVAKTKLILDDIDAAEYLQMGVESIANAILQGRMKGLMLSSFALLYRAQAVVENNCKFITTLPFELVLRDRGIISVTNCGASFHPRKLGVERTVLNVLAAPTDKATYTVVEQTLEWERDPGVADVDIFMVPNLMHLSNSDEFLVPRAAKDILFVTAFEFIVNQQKMGTPFKNNMNPNPNGSRD